MNDRQRRFMLRAGGLLIVSGLALPLAFQSGTLARLFLGPSIFNAAPAILTALGLGIGSRRILAGSDGNELVIVGASISSLIALYGGTQRFMMERLQEVASAATALDGAGAIGGTGAVGGTGSILNLLGPTIPMGLLIAAMLVCLNLTLLRGLGIDDVDLRWVGLYLVPIGVYTIAPAVLPLLL